MAGTPASSRTVLPSPPLLSDLALAAPQSIPNNTPTNLVLAVSGTNGVSATIDAAGIITLPVGWYVATAQVYWAANVVGSRYAGFGQLGSGLGTGVVAPATSYPLLDTGNGCSVSGLFYYAAAASSVTLTVMQDSGGALEVGSGLILRIQKLA